MTDESGVAPKKAKESAGAKKSSAAESEKQGSITTDSSTEVVSQTGLAESVVACEINDSDSEELESSDSEEIEEVSTSPNEANTAEEPDNDDDEESNYGDDGDNQPAKGDEVEHLLEYRLVRRAQRASELLKIHLTGVTRVDITDEDHTFIIDWRTGDPKTEKCNTSALPKQASITPDCTLQLSRKSLLGIASGDLNPQIAMLSDKIAVDGKAAFAVYFFNLVAPYSSPQP